MATPHCSDYRSFVVSFKAYSTGAYFMGSVSPPTLSLLFNIVLAILGPFEFHDFYNGCFLSYRKEKCLMI